MKVTDVIDHYSENPVYRPDGKSIMKYDFRLYYINMSNEKV